MAKKWLAALAATVVLAMGGGALAEVYEGSCVAAELVTVAAPCSGTLVDVDILSGQAVQAGDVLAELGVQKLFAGRDGRVARIQQSSDGAVVELEPVERYTVYCTVDDAYPSAASTLVHAGEELYLRCTVNGTHRALGTITRLDGDEYCVEVTGGELYVGETVYLYRDADFSTSQRVGIGTVVQSDVERYEVQGSWVELHVSEGEAVQRGELLLSYVDGSSPQLLASVDGVVAEVLAEAGAQLEEGQAICSILPDGALQAEVWVPEAEIGRFELGERVTLVLAASAEEGALYGEVASMAYIAEDGMYAVRISPASDAAARELRLGMSVAVRTEGA